MTVTETLMALGKWQLKLSIETPQEILNKLGYFGHICILETQQDPRLAGDALLQSCRYVGVMRERNFSGVDRTFGGPGMAFWLGDEDGKGDVIEDGLTFTNTTFTQGVRDLLPTSLLEGTLHSVTGLKSASYSWIDRRKAMSDWVSYFSNSYGEAEWRVNNDGTLDAGTIDQLYVTDPDAIIARRMSGVDMQLRGLDGDASTDEDVEDFSTRVVVLAQGQGASTATGAADINPASNPYVDLQGNDLRLTRLVSQSGTDSTNAVASAQ